MDNSTRTTFIEKIMLFYKLLRRLSDKIMKPFFSPIFFVFTFVYIEIVFHIAEFNNTSLIYPIIFAIPSGIFFGLLCDLLPEKAARVARYGISVLFSLLFCVQIVYFHSFQSFMSLSQVGMGGDVFTNFFKSIVLAVWESLHWIILLFLPVVLLAVLHAKHRPSNRFNWKKSLALLVCFLVAHFTAVISLTGAGTNAHSPYDIYHDNWVLDLSTEKLGLLTTTGLDLKYFLFPNVEIGNEEPDVPIIVLPPVADLGSDTTTTQPSNPDPDGSDITSPEPPKPQYNVISGLDFGAMAENESDATLKAVLQYLDALEPSKKNEYTGMFEGYNLIMICAESFSPMAINKDLTPTLYKLANSGFVFNNYWATFPSNTTNGEYEFLTGLIPDLSKPKKDGSFLFTAKNNITMNMTFASFFNAKYDVDARGYHPHISTYYSRNLTHPRIGYTTFKGKNEIGGLTGWPESDLVMAQRTINEYINDDIFHTYIMSVSGHHNYKFGGYNTIADKNKDLVSGLNMIESGKAYLACHIELDRMLEFLITELQKAGKLEKTVICLSTDHFPYGLTDNEYRKLLGRSWKYDALDRWESNLILWNSEMETVQIDKPCCPADVLPTLLNLFGYEYDSRLYSGTDILSDSYGLAMMSNHSFVNDKIVYNSRYQKVYKLDKSWTMPEGYLEAYIQIVKNRFSIASNILNYDFYAKLPKELVDRAQSGTRLPLPTN